MPKKDFYKGNNFFNDPIVKNYEQGKYFNTKTKCLEVINKPANRYNTEFLRRVNDLNSQFYALISSYGILIKLLDKHKDELYGIINNMYRVMKSQGGTIRYNKIFKRSLRKYGITKQDLLDSLELAIKRQEDRVVRNKALLIQTMKECGFEGVIEAIEKETHTDIFTNIVNFIDEQRENQVLINDESLDIFYDEVKVSYIQYLEEIAAKYNIDLYKDISDKLLNTLELRREKAKQSDAEYRKKVKDTKMQNKLALLNKDNINLQSDIAHLADIAEERIQGNKIKQKTARRLIRQFGKINSPIIYYIGIVKEYSIKYYSKTSMNNESGSIVNAYITSDKNELITIQNELKKEYTNAIIDILRLDIRYRITESNSISILPDSSIRNIISMRLEAISHDCLSLLFKAVRQSNGYVCNTNSYKGSVIIQVNMNATNEDEQLLCKNSQGFYFGSPRDNNVVMHKLGSINLLNTQVVVINGERIKVKPLKVDFESKNLKETLSVVQKLSGNIQGLLLRGIDDIEQCFERQITQVKICTLRRRIIDENIKLLYFVTIVDDFWYNYHALIKCAKLKNADRITNDISSMDLYTTKEEAMNAIKKIENHEHNNYLYVINTLDVRLMK